MAGRRRAATAFRPSTPSGPSRAPSRRQTAVMLVVVLAVAGTITVASFVVKPDKARSFDLFYGSVFVDDNLSPVAIDLSSGKATVRLSDAPSAVSATRSQDLDMVPLTGGTLMLDPTTGEFNMLDSSGFVLKSTGGGVRLPQLRDSRDELTTAVPSGDSAYLVRPSPSGTAVYLVGQSTVASAAGVTSGAKPRAKATLDVTTADDPAAMTSANGDLFLLTGGVGATHRLVQMTLPSGSNAGADLTVRRSARVTGVAALGSATANADGTGGDVVGVASRDTVRVVTPDGTQRVETVRTRGDVDAIIPVRNAQGALVFLYHSTDSWNVVRASTTGGTTATVSRVDGIDAGIDLITPVESAGRVYTLGDDADGSLFQIAADGKAQPIKGVEQYPRVAHEPLTLDGAEITAEGSRVIFDSRANFRVVVVFADGSQPPRIVDKHSAVQVDTNGAASVANPTDKPNDKPKPGKKPKPQAHPEQAINNKINCRVVSQTPHIPSVQLVQRASRSVQLHWFYPLLDPQDCDPSTYTVSVRLLSNDAPPAPATVTVQGQDGVNLTGLFPDTKYEIVVTAYINKLHTPSPALVVSTSVEGPPAPTGVRTSVDSAGNWTITWHSCGGVQSGCVSTADWQIIPHLCDGVGLAGTPETRRRVGDPTQHTFAYTYDGSETLLGRGLSFEVQGIGEKGTIGDSAADSSCSYSWTPTVAKDIEIHASAPPMTTSSATTHTTVSVDFAGGQQHDLGGMGGEMTYELLQDGSVVAREGPTTKTTMTLPGISAGRNYQVAVIVNPARHRSATERIGPIDVKAAIARWPQPTVSASFHETSAYQGRLTLDIALPQGTNTRGETFDLANTSYVRCSNTQIALDRQGLGAADSVGFDIDRTELNSLKAPCRVHVALVQNADTVSHPPLFGDGTTSPGAFAGGVTIDPPSLTAGAVDFQSTWNSSAPLGDPMANVAYNGGDSTFLLHSTAWDIRLSNDGGATNCGEINRDFTPSSSATVMNVHKDCIRSGGKFTAQFSFGFYGERQTFTVDINGTAPTPVDPTKISFVGEWSNPLLGRSTVRVEYTGPYDQQTVDSLRWSYTVTSDQSTETDCLEHGVDYSDPDTDGSGPNLQVAFNRCPSDVNGTAAIYTLDVSFVDPNYGVVGDYPVQIQGTP